jgi:hypothetical protein
MSEENKEEIMSDTETSKTTLEMDNVEGDRHLETLFSELDNWTKSLSRRAERIPPLIRAVLESDEPLPEDCPSKATAAAMELRQIEKSLDEVKNIYMLIDNHLFENYSDSIQPEAFRKTAS